MYGVENNQFEQALENCWHQNLQIFRTNNYIAKEEHLAYPGEARTY